MLYLAVLSVTITLISARPSSSDLARPFRALAGAPYKRQYTDVPAICAAICDPVINEVNIVSCITGISHVDVPILVQGCTAKVCCTQIFQTDCYNCLLCIGTADNTTNYSAAQINLDSESMRCYAT